MARCNMPQIKQRPLYRNMQVNITMLTEANLMSKTYAKLREVTIDYNFPKKMAGKNIYNQSFSFNLWP